jgi:HSP20 family protein
MVYRTAIAAPAVSLRREIDRLFDDTLSALGANGANGTTRVNDWMPPVDIRESEGELTISLEIPGVSPENIQLTTDNGVLTVSGEKVEERKEDQQRRYHLVERSYGSFSRSFRMPKNLDDSKIEATFEHGVLTVHIPKAAIPQPRKIEVRAAGSQPAVTEGASGAAK